MTEEPETDVMKLETKQTLKALSAVGIVATLFTLLLAGRMLWEETSLTLERGPQMLGFSLAHGPGAILFLAPILLALWLLIALITMAVWLWRKRFIGPRFWSTLIFAVLTLGLLSIPPEFWQWAFIGSFAKSSHAADLMLYNAAEGNLRTVHSYLRHGVPITAKNYEGSNAAFTAAAGGSLPTLEMLTSMGVDLNATNAYGDSPLEAATENHHTEAASFLKAHGAAQIRGSEEQHQTAAHAIVMRDMERLKERGP